MLLDKNKLFLAITFLLATILTREVVPTKKAHAFDENYSCSWTGTQCIPNPDDCEDPNCFFPPNDECSGLTQIECSAPALNDCVCGDFNPVGQGTCADHEAYSAIGCIPVGSPQEFVVFIAGWAVMIAGGIALLMIIYGGFMVITSAGNPKQIQSGKELVGAAMAGLTFLIFGSFILRLVGVNILRIF